ncbi:MAG: extracellular solute-binding protein [Defluviitaleaceae bacterium]|nr:extracellular solute-binding protein [Defluviitaleaceae bacterium]MCL2238736.1 extracellular solute-binding protein [Defluviitaleaceae bacterium]
MKKLYPFLLFAVLLAGLLAFSACGGSDDTPAQTPAPPAPPVANVGANQQPTTPVEGATPAAPPRDLGGIEIFIANWWEDYDTDTFEPRSAAERERLADRIYLQERHNFRIREVRAGDWEWARDNHAVRLITRNEEFHIWNLAPNWYGNAAPRGLFAPIPQTFFSEGYGGQMVWHRDSMNFAAMFADTGYTYGFTARGDGGGVPMTGGIAFNMRLFEEAGLPRDYPFILQREGRWTWDEFIRVGTQIQRDVDGDGVIDIFAHLGFNQEITARAVFSNGATFVDFCNDTDRLVSTINTPEFFEALEFLVNLRQVHGLGIHEEDLGTDQWDFFVEMFNHGHAAMRTLTHGHVLAQVEPSLNDDWGFVAFPRGPRAANHYTYSTGGNLMAIPAVFGDQVDDIMYAFMLWHRPLGIDEDDDVGDADDWIFEQLPFFPDERSVYETMVYHTRNPNLQRMSWHEILPGDDEIWRSLFAWRVWNDVDTENIVWNDPAQIIEAAQLEWEATIEAANRALGFID